MGSNLDHVLVVVHEALVAKSACKVFLCHFLCMTFRSMSFIIAAVSCHFVDCAELRPIWWRINHRWCFCQAHCLLLFFVWMIAGHKTGSHIWSIEHVENGKNINFSHHRVSVFPSENMPLRKIVNVDSMWKDDDLPADTWIRHLDYYYFLAIQRSSVCPHR